MRRKKRQVESGTDGVMRTSVPTRQPQAGPFPLMQTPAQAIVMPNTGSFDVQSNGMPLGLPTYTSIDEYGRAFTPAMHYGPQPNSAPVPIPKPSTIVQLPTITAPVNFYANSSSDEREV
jgi:hypothetical protein